MEKKTKTTKNKVGQPSKLTPELQAKIVELLRAGNYFSTACWACGISKQTGYTWRDNGEAEEVLPQEERTAYYDFYAAVEVAQALSEIENLAQVKLGGKDWACHMTIMERRWPDKWGRWERKEQSGTVTLRVEYDDSNRGKESSNSPSQS